MARVVALLRGVNIGKRQLPMAALREGLAAAGATDVETYVQSGNVVLAVPKGVGRDVDGWLEHTISEIAGFEVLVVVRTAKELAAIVDGNPYAGASGKQLHVIACAPRPPASLLEAIDLDGVAPEHASVAGADIYLHLPDGMGRAKLPALIERELKRAKVVGTARNWNTIERLHAMATT